MIETIQNIFRCPASQKKLIFSQLHNHFTVEDEDTIYPFSDEILDFSPSFSKEIQFSEIATSYDRISKIYDSLISGSNFLSSFIIHLTWGGPHEDYTDEVINYIPDDFSGILLDIPAGTGTYSFEKYAKLKNALIIVADISKEMLLIAKKRFSKFNHKNIIYVLADAGNLPLKSESVDCVVSMNGFHSFPEKENAASEIARVLKTHGHFSGCFYVRGKRFLSDFMVNFSLKKSNLFAGPFYTDAEYRTLFSKNFNFNKMKSCRSFFLFDCLKK